MGKITKLIRNWFSEQKNQERHPFAQEKQILSESYKIRHIQPTPNPDAFRFVTNKSILGEGTIHFDSSEKAKGDMTSFAKSMSRALKKYIPDGVKEEGVCLECNSGGLVRQEGCVTCTQCGWSKCI